MPLFKRKDTRRKQIDDEPLTPLHPLPVTQVRNQQDIDIHKAVICLEICAAEVKARALRIPLVFLPFRPNSMSATIESLMCRYYSTDMPREDLARELMLVEVLDVVCALRWTYSRIRGGVLSLKRYELFRRFEKQSRFSCDCYKVILAELFECKEKEKSFYILMDLLTSITANEAYNGHSVKKLAKSCAVLIFQNDMLHHEDFRTAYSSWNYAAYAMQHMVLGYLRTIQSETTSGVSLIPFSLLSLLEQEQYPPPLPNSATLYKALKLKINSSNLSSSPIVLLERAISQAHRVDSAALQSLADAATGYGLTDECYRVLRAIEAVYNCRAEKLAHDAMDADWLQFQNYGFSYPRDADKHAGDSVTMPEEHSVIAEPSIGTSVRRRTPDWSNFTEAGFRTRSGIDFTTILPMHLHLPAVTDQSQELYSRSENEDATLTEVNTIRIDDTLWEAWLMSITSEMPTDSKCIFGRCIVLQSDLTKEWIIIEEAARMSDLNIGCSLGTKKAFGVKWTREPEPLAVPTSSESRHNHNDDLTIVEARIRELLSNSHTPSICRSMQSPHMASQSSKLELIKRCNEELTAVIAWTDAYDNKSVSDAHESSRSTQSVSELPSYSHDQLEGTVSPTIRLRSACASAVTAPAVSGQPTFVADSNCVMMNFKKERLRMFTKHGLLRRLRSIRLKPKQIVRDTNGREALDKCGSDRVVEYGSLVSADVRPKERLSDCSPSQNNNSVASSVYSVFLEDSLSAMLDKRDLRRVKSVSKHSHGTRSQNKADPSTSSIASSNVSTVVLASQPLHSRFIESGTENGMDAEITST